MQQKLVINLLSICLIVVGAGSLLVSPARAADAVVGSGTPGSCDEAAFNSALMTALAGGGTITFDCGAAAHTITFSIRKEISNNVIIDGDGKITLDGNNSAAFFQVFFGQSLTLRQIALRRGVFSLSHALENFGTLTLDGVTLTQNISTESPVANSGTLIVLNSTLSENQITGASNGGAINNDGGTVAITGTTFISNTVPGGGNGGAIATQNGPVTVVDSTFTGNSAVDGGAMSCLSDSLSVTGSTFSHNEATGNGGGIYSTCSLTMANVTLSENQATGVGSGGGAIYQEGSNAGTVTYATIADNTATVFGGGVFNDDSGGSSLTISKSLLVNNTTGNCDGVVMSGGYNLTTDTNCGNFTQTGDQQNLTLALAALGNYGGPTSTRPPLTDSPALDAIPTAQCGILVDQRGVSRPQADGCDIGAVEGTASRQVYLPVVMKG